MRGFWIFLNALFVLFLSFEALASVGQTSNKVPAKEAICRYITGDVGTIVGRGADKNKALADAAEQCFDRRVRLFEQARQTTVDMDRGQDIIDSCINISCS